MSRRGVIRTIAAALTGGATLAAAGSADAATTVCRNPGASCTRNIHCCSKVCERGRSVPRRNRNRCACEEGLVLRNGRCVDACEVLVCGDDQVCHTGACRTMCVSGICADGLTCIAAVEACVPIPCLADPSLSASGVCYTFLDGSFIPNSQGGNTGPSCTTDTECEEYFEQNPTGLKETFPDLSYDVSCIVTAVQYGFQIHSEDYLCVEHMY